MARLRHSLLSIITLIALLCCGITVALAAPPTPGNAERPLELNWLDVDTGAVLFSLADIVRFDWDRQIIELTPERATQLLALPVVQRRDFAVRDHEGIIYRGRFYRSSATEAEGYDGTTILIDQGPLRKLPASPFFTITGGYPTGGGAHDRERFSDRLRVILTAAGRLASIRDEEVPIQRLWSGHTWVGGEQVLKASAVLFPQTFRVEKDAYIHLLLYKGQQPVMAFDKLVVTASCVAEEGKFTSQQEILTIVPPLLDNGIYVCKLQPWQTYVSPTERETAYSPASASGQLPSYPKDALNDNREGRVTALITVDSDAKVSDVAIISSGHDDLDRSVRRALQKFTFTPVKVDGKPERSVLRVQFSFEKRKVSQTVLPPDPVRVVAKPGPMDLSFEITAYKREGNAFTKIGAWSLPTTRKINLLPELAPPADAAK